MYGGGGSDVSKLLMGYGTELCGITHGQHDASVSYEWDLEITVCISLSIRFSNIFYDTIQTSVRLFTGPAAHEGNC